MGKRWVLGREQDRVPGEGLRNDLARLVGGTWPTRRRLARAPLLDAWSIDRRGLPILTGRVTGHPLLRDERIWTTPLVVLDRERGIARTLSRWYRLGVEDSDGPPVEPSPAHPRAVLPGDALVLVDALVDALSASAGEDLAAASRVREAQARLVWAGLDPLAMGLRRLPRPARSDWPEPTWRSGHDRLNACVVGVDVQQALRRYHAAPARPPRPRTRPATAADEA